MFAYMTIKSQRQQISEQQAFIAEQSANLQLERDLLQAQADDRKHAQARALRVGAEITHSRDTAYGPGPADHWEVTVDNVTDEPVTDVWVRFGDAYTALDVALLDGHGNPVGTPRGVPLDVLGPRRRFRFNSSRMGEAVLENLRPTVLFRDAAGLRWRLDGHGVLQEIGDDVTG